MKRTAGGVVAIAVALVVAMAAAPAAPAQEDEGPTLEGRRLHSYREQMGAEEGQSFGATAATVNYVQPYSVWCWVKDPVCNKGAAGYTIIKEAITVRESAPAGDLFWAHQFFFPGADGGYVGLQVTTANKLAIFSIFGANGARGRNCAAFGHEGDGFSCRIEPYPWRVGRPYRLQVRRLTADAQGLWYSAAVIDTATGANTEIGQIRVPKAWNTLVGWVSFTEYFGPGLEACSDIHVARARFETPVGGDKRPVRHEHRILQGAGLPPECTANVKITDVAGGDQHDMSPTPP